MKQQLPIIHGSTHGFGGSDPTARWEMFGDGNPVGVITPTQKGARYQDTLNGALYEAVGVTSADWIAVGGEADFTIPGVATSLGTLTLTAADGLNAILTDTGAAVGTGNGLYWNATGGDGNQVLQLFLGAATVVGLWDADGLYHPYLPTTDPAVSGAIWNSDGAVVLSGSTGPGIKYDVINAGDILNITTTAYISWGIAADWTATIDGDWTTTVGGATSITSTGGITITSADDISIQAAPGHTVNINGTIF